jgi:hypothetical protein
MDTRFIEHNLWGIKKGTNTVNNKLVKLKSFTYKVETEQDVSLKPT